MTEMTQIDGNPAQRPIDIVYRDDDIVAVNKPSGLLCVPGLSSPDNLFERVQAQFPNARVVHRLDMATSGLVLFALNHATQKALGQLFANREIRKEYRALVYGLVNAAHGEICAPIMTDWPNRPRQKIDWREGKASLTAFSVTEQRVHSPRSAVTLYPHTGRSHQLRIHLWLIGHPILGDELYSLGTSADGSRQMCLHATRLFFTHPRDKMPINLTCLPQWHIDDSAVLHQP